MTIFHPPPTAADQKTATLADVLAALNQRTDLPPIRLRDLRSAVARLCKLIGADPADVPLHYPTLRALLAAVNPVAKGIKVKSLDNLRSAFGAAVAASGLMPDIVFPRTKPKLTPSWKALLEGLFRRRYRHGLMRLARLCSRLGIEPNEVDDEVIAALVAEVEETSLRMDQQQVHRDTTKIWNEAVARLPGLGLRVVTVPPSRRRFTRIKPEDFPESFRKDTDDYLAWCGVSDPFAENARQRALAPRTIVGTGVYINAAATALVKSGTDISSIRALKDLLSRGAFRSILLFRMAQVEGRENCYNFGVALTLIQIARDWVHVDPQDLAELKRMARKLPGQSTGRMTDKNKKRLRQFDDPNVRQRLLDAPIREWRKVMNDQKANSLTLTKAEAAIAAAFLTYMPIRLQNLNDLAYEKHLFLRPEPGAISTLEIPGEEVKNKKIPIAFDIPPFVAKMLIEFRDVLAPKILGYSPSHVFINRDGSLKKGPSIRQLIQRFMERWVGVEFNPHTFRHLAGKFILDTLPGGHEIVRELLGHASIETTARFYTGIETRRAGRHHWRLIEDSIAERSKPPRRKRRKKASGDGGE